MMKRKPQISQITQIKNKKIFIIFLATKVREETRKALYLFVLQSLKNTDARRKAREIKRKQATLNRFHIQADALDQLGSLSLSFSLITYYKVSNTSQYRLNIGISGSSYILFVSNMFMVGKCTNGFPVWGIIPSYP